MTVVKTAKVGSSDILVGRVGVRSLLNQSAYYVLNYLISFPWLPARIDDDDVCPLCYIPHRSDGFSSVGGIHQSLKRKLSNP